MADQLHHLIRHVALGSLASLAVMPAKATAVTTPDNTRNSTPPETLDGTTLHVLKTSRPRLILAMSTTQPPLLVTSHRSHRSHSSHSSHYSSSRGGGGGGGGGTASPQRPATRAPLAGIPQAPAESIGQQRLGSRVLAKGMKGPDVDELMLLLTKAGYLKPADFNKVGLFTEEVENAVKAFQKVKELAETGKVNAATLLVLKSAT